MSQKAKHGEKKGAKTTSQVGQSARGASTPAEESKALGPAQKATPGNTKRLQRNLDEKVAGKQARPPCPAAKKPT